MLEIKQLTKKYKPKKGVPVTALNGVSLTFPETGMLFLLGKSGSGKSTLLNLLGGLDSYDSGEILISGVSSKSFRQSDFDSYRNTLVGFIFQEYNVLEEFTVGANIALAIELQGRKAKDEEIARILSEVDLEGYGARRPNELSGGQKQRVAIARALVKNPKIIMADEPTGALDSVTGRQVLDTLKKLSRTKLVIVVSHDEEFAYQYGDRIITLSDGTVISDEAFAEETEAFAEKGILFGDDAVMVSAGYHLTEEDREKINQYLDAMEEGKKLSIRRQEKTRRIKKQGPEEPGRVFAPIRFIPSRLPMKAAFRIGSGALKHKKIRLAFTIFLSCIAFGLFGLADTFGAYDHIRTCVRSLQDSAIEYASVVRAEKYRYSDDPEGFYYRQEGKLSQEDLEKIRTEGGVVMQGVLTPFEADLNFHSLYNEEAEFTKSDFHIYPYSFNGFAEITEKTLSDMGQTLLAGKMPDGNKNEILITSYICETFYIGGFAVENEDGTIEYEAIKSPQDMVGRVFPLGDEAYTVSGVISSGVDLERYRSLTEKREDDSTAQMLLDYALLQELNGIRDYSLCQVAFLGEGRLLHIMEKEPLFQETHNGHVQLEWKVLEKGEEYYYGTGSRYLGTLSDAGNYKIAWVDGQKESLKENEVIISLDLLQSIGIYPQGVDVYDEEGNFFFSRMTKEEKDLFIQEIRDLPDLICSSFSYRDYDSTYKEVEHVRIVGILLPDESGLLPTPKEVILANETLVDPIIVRGGGIFSYAVGNLPQEESALKKLVSYSYSEEGDVRYELQNPVCFELDAIHEVLVFLADVFLYVGIGFAVFASLMLANFIGTSIAYKKQQIGILRAIGARSNDVFRIFFSESFVIAMINFTLSAIGCFGVVTLINHLIRTETGILITILNFSFRQVILLFLVSLLVAGAASFFPVKKIASKKPIDAIRGR